MSGLEPAVRVLRSIAEVASGEGALARLNAALCMRAAVFGTPGDRPTIRTEVFTGLPDGGGAGAAASLTTRLADGQLAIWTVEVWIDTWQDVGSWSAIVKAELEVGAPLGEPETLFDVERTVHDAGAAADAVRECAELVAGHQPG